MRQGRRDASKGFLYRFITEERRAHIVTGRPAMAKLNDRRQSGRANAAGKRRDNQRIGSDTVSLGFRRSSVALEGGHGPADPRPFGVEALSPVGRFCADRDP